MSARVRKERGPGLEGTAYYTTLVSTASRYERMQGFRLRTHHSRHYPAKINWQMTQVQVTLVRTWPHVTDRRVAREDCIVVSSIIR